MHIAQKRDAARTEKFYFRKKVIPAPRSPSASSASSVSSSCESCNANGMNGFHRPKEKKLRNCFPAPPMPENGFRHRPVEDEYELMTMEEIMVGKADDFPGLLGVVDMFLETLDVDEVTGKKLRSYLDFVRRRATGDRYAIW